jgi:hypothetical protein
MAAKQKQFGRLNVSVTEKDIEEAKANDSMMCVVAHAIARTFPEAKRIGVDVQSIRWTDSKDRYIYLTPYAVQGYIVAFDAGDVIEPFSFTLDSRKAIPVKRYRQTEAGKALTSARNKVRNRKTRQAHVEATTPLASTAERTEAKARTEAAERELADVKTAYHGQVTQHREGEGHRQAPPRVFKGARERQYGMRLMRVNQRGTGDDDEPDADDEP